MTRTSRMLCSLSAALLLLGSGAAMAGTEADPEITDQGDDANYLSRLDPDPQTPQFTTPALDLLKVWFSTRYTVEKDRDAAGAVTRVRYVPDALVASIQTAGPKQAMYAGGYLLGYVVVARAQDGCGLQLFADLDPETGAPDSAQVSGCGPAIDLDLANVTFAGNTMMMTVPLTVAPFLGPGVPIQPGSATDPTSARAHFLGNMAADVAIGGRTFVVGSDVPEDVDCLNTPQHAACAG